MSTARFSLLSTVSDSVNLNRCLRCEEPLAHNFRLQPRLSVALAGLKPDLVAQN